MKPRITALLLLAFVVSLICSYAIWHSLASNISAARHGRAQQVVTVTKDVPAGGVLNADILSTIDIVGTLPKGAIQDQKAVAGRAAIFPLYEGEPVIESRLAAKGSGGGLAATIPAGMRVCAIKVDDVVAAGGFATAGMRVDVLASGTPPNAQSSSGSEVRTILQNIQVASAGTEIQRDPEGKPQQVQVVNLLVTPQQAETLSLAGGGMKIQLVLRNPTDTQVVQVEGAATGTLFSGPSQPKAPVKVSNTIQRPKAAPAPAFLSVEVLNGSKRSMENVAVPGGQR